MRCLVLVIALSAAILGGAAWWWSRAADHASQTASPDLTVALAQGTKMEKFSLRDTQSQRTRWEILADVAQGDPKTDITTMQGVHLTLFSAKHGTVQVTGQHGVIENQSKDMRVCGNVQLVVGQEFALTTECLQWRAVEQALETDTPVAIQMGHLQVEGRGFRGWLAEERFEIREQVLARWSEL
jgi:LPS export ABC transporter protein LptC